jgi:uncharacterized protein (DUF433 family)
MERAQQIYPGVVVDPEVVHGKPVLAGTRIPVALVLGQLAAGVDFEELEREYGVTRQQASAALGYAAQLVASESVYTAESAPAQ